MVLRRFPVLLLLATVALAGSDDPGPVALRRLRSADAGRRRETLEALAASPAPARGPERKRIVAVLRKLLVRERDPRVRGLAARVLRAVGDPVDLLAVVDRLRRERDDRTHPGLLAALDGVDDEAVIEAVHAAATGDGEERVRGVMILALGGFEGDRVLRTLHRLASRDRPWAVTTSALIALGRKRDKEIVALLIRRLRARDPAARAMALESLVHLTGLDLGEDRERWEAWWDEIGGEFRFPDPDREPLASGGKAYAPASPLLPRYYGIPIRGRRVAFCFDLSASMWGPTFDAAAAELIRAVKMLPTRSEFSVVFFNQYVWRWRDEPSPAFPWPKAELFAHLRSLETKSFTNIHDALENALGLAGRGRYADDPPPGVDDVFLISDGEPNRGRHRGPRGIARSILRLNTPRAARIHCIALGDKPRELLRRVARENGGEFVDGR